MRSGRPRWEVSSVTFRPSRPSGTGWWTNSAELGLSKKGFTGGEQEGIHGGVVLDGRDTGTVVFPDADVKIFMEADLDERARRRQNEYASEGKDVSFEAVRKEITRRDEQDRNREIAPLCRADDAIELDSTDMTIDGQVAFVVDRVKECQEPGT